MVWWVDLLSMLILILLAAHLFSNALEYFGEKMGMSTGVTGSILAAVATALPETSVPIIALLAGTANAATNTEISIGAILGPPLMLSTLSISIIALVVIRKRGFFGRLTPEKTGYKRDLHFFLLALIISTLAFYLPPEPHYSRILISILLIALYITYLIFTIVASRTLVKAGHGVVTNEPLLFSKFGLPANFKIIILQMTIGVILLLVGAKGFVKSIEHLSHLFKVSPLLLSIIIVPIATELPEKVNSAIWIRQNKDTLSFGNITGAMVFQGTLLPALGILFTPWQPNNIILVGIMMTLIAVLWLRLTIFKKGTYVGVLLLNGLLYLLYLAIIFKGGI